MNNGKRAMDDNDQTISYAIWNMAMCMRDLMKKPSRDVLDDMIEMEAIDDYNKFGRFLLGEKID